MWRNGRRNGLKIRSREKRGMGSNPIIGTSKKTIYLGKLVRGDQVVVREWSRTKTHEKTVYSSSNRQVNACKPEFRYCDSSGAFGGLVWLASLTRSPRLRGSSPEVAGV